MVLRMKTTRTFLVGATSFLHEKGSLMPSLKWPASCKTITQAYGNKNARYAKGYHTGIDMGCMAGSPIYAAHDGTVTFAGYNGSYGNEVRVAYNSTFLTSYHHMSRIAARRGQVVSAGTVIGYIGSTGMSTGPHLHFEVRINGKDVNPSQYLAGAALPSGGVIQADNPLDSIPGVGEAKAVYDALKGSLAIFEWLTDTKNWYRIGLVVGGAALIWFTFMTTAQTKALGTLVGKKVKSSAKSGSGGK